MRSTVFELKFPPNAPDREVERNLKFSIPTLRAYAIEYSEFTFKGGLGEHKEMVEGQDYTLVDDGLIWRDFFAPLSPVTNGYRLVIHYHGIKEYNLLFPHVKTSVLQQRLGEFYKEAEASLDSGTWLAFALMCGAIYEGLLYHHFGEKKKSFDKLIEKGQKNEILNDATVKTLRVAQGLRNLVHADRVGEPYVTRAQALEMRTVLDRMIKDAAGWVRE